jgi:hypothetical protein
MTELEMKIPIPYTGTDPIEAKIYESRIAQYINISRNWKTNVKNFTCHTVILFTVLEDILVHKV